MKWKSVPASEIFFDKSMLGSYRGVPLCVCSYKPVFGD